MTDSGGSLELLNEIVRIYTEKPTLFPADMRFKAQLGSDIACPVTLFRVDGEVRCRADIAGYVFIQGRFVKSSTYRV